MKSIASAAVVFVFATTPVVAFGQSDDSDTSEETSEEVTHYKFKASDIESLPVVPGGDQIDITRHEGMKGLIEIRDNFVWELMASTEDI